MPNARKPAALRQARHSSRAQVVELVPAEDVMAPEAPQGLLEATTEAWAVFWEGQVARALAPEDVPKVRRLFKLYDLWERAVAIFEETPLVGGSKGQLRLHPMSDKADRLSEQIRGLETDLGIGPAARLRLGLTAGQVALTVDEVQERVRRRMQGGSGG
jgi:P27 family predicted phage terminase small subunit